MWGASNSTGYFRDPSKWGANEDFERKMGQGWLNQANAPGVQQGATAQLNDIAAGKGTLDEYLKKNPGAFEQLLAYTNPATANKAAAGQVEGNDLFKGMFGAGGIQEGRQNSEKDLMSRGFSLQPEDNEAYGQASDNIARMFGNTENNISQALSARGLAAGPSGAAGVAYSGLQGNKNEQLAQSQRQIANDRMQMNLQRLTAMQGAVNQGNQLAQGALQSQRGMNQQALTNYNDMNANSVNAASNLNAQNKSEYDQQQASGFNPMTALGGVAMTGLGAATGGLGTGIAAGITKNMFSAQPQGANYYAGNEASPGFVGPRKP